MKTIIPKLLKPQSKHAKLLLLLLLVLAVSEELLNLWEPAKMLLNQDRLAIKFGSNHITLYSVIKSIFAIVAVFWVAAIISDFGEKRISRIRNIRSSNKVILIKVYQILLYFIAVIVVLDVIGIDLTAFTVFGGAIGIGLGFGLQKVTSNFISGLILLFERSVEKDDLIELADGTFGYIRHMGARYILVETSDGKEIMIPNEDFITNRVTNWTYTNSRGRVEIPVCVSYNSDSELAQKLILEAAKEHTLCMTEPAPACCLRMFGDNGLNFILHFWVADVTQGRMLPQSEVMFAILKKFKEHGIEIPGPQQEVYIRALPAEMLGSTRGNA